jgi:hypothetical protein
VASELRGSLARSTVRSCERIITLDMAGTGRPDQELGEVSEPVDGAPLVNGLGHFLVKAFEALVVPGPLLPGKLCQARFRRTAFRRTRSSPIPGAVLSCTFTEGWSMGARRALLRTRDR